MAIAVMSAWPTRASRVTGCELGYEEQFIERRTEFVSWSKDNFPAMASASLLRDRGVPGHFVSFAEWADPESRESWKQSPEFMDRFSACTALCDGMTGADYDRVVTV